MSVCTPWSGLNCVRGEVTSILLSGRALSGSIPSALGQLSYVTSIDLSLNKLNGTVPSTLGLLSQLSSLKLDNNHLTGLVPAAINSMSSLTLLSLSRNKIRGSLPSSMGLMPKLRYLSLASTSLTGSLPSFLCSDGLTYLALYNSSLFCYSYCFSTVTSKYFGAVSQCGDASNGLCLKRIHLFCLTISCCCRCAVLWACCSFEEEFLSYNYARLEL